MRVKIFFFTIILFSFISELEARGKGKKNGLNFRPSKRINVNYISYPGFGYNYWGYNNWNNNYRWSYDPYWDFSYRPINAKEFELADADIILDQVVKLKEFNDKGIITDKEYQKTKKRLIDRVGKLIPNHKKKNSSEAINQIEKLFNLQEKEVLTKKEFEKKKKRMLLLI